MVVTLGYGSLDPPIVSLLSCHICLDWPLTSGLKCAPADLVVTIPGLSESPVSFDHVRPLLRDHDGGGVGVPGHHMRHD